MSKISTVGAVILIIFAAITGCVIGYERGFNAGVNEPRPTEREQARQDMLDNPPDRADLDYTYPVHVAYAQDMEYVGDYGYWAESQLDPDVEDPCNSSLCYCSYTIEVFTPHDIVVKSTRNRPGEWDVLIFGDELMTGEQARVIAASGGDFKKVAIVEKEYVNEIS